MQWTSQLATGDSHLDAQFQAILTCLDDLKRATQENRTMFAVYTLTRLKHHVRDLCDSEEIRLRNEKAAKVQARLREFNDFRTYLGGLQRNSVNGDIPMSTVSAIATWLEQQINTIVTDITADRSSPVRCK